MLRQAAFRLSLGALAAAQADRWLPAVRDAAGFVVTLHHVRPERPPAFAPNAHLSVTPAFLDAFIARFKAKGWRFVPVTELVAGPDSGGAARRIAITLDDGFRDNLEHALPVFKRHAAPFTIYACPGFSDRTAELWWIALERIITGTDLLSLPGEGPAERVSTTTVSEKRRAFRLWADWLTLEADEARQRRVVRALAEKYGLDLAALARELIMDWDELRRIAAEPLAAIGAHTMTHPALARLPPQAAFREMAESADRIEAEIGRRPATIAFPYGYATAATEREAQLAGQAGFAASFTTRPGYAPAAGSRQGLPRVSLNGLYQEVKLFDVLLSHGFWQLRKRMRGGG